MSRQSFEIAGQLISPGQRATLDIPISELYSHTSLTMPVQVVHGRGEGPVVFVSAAIHGDEILGVEIIRRLLRLPALKRLKGTLVSAPIVNVFGFNHRSRYLPDRRDLNRSFPGSLSGSMAARLADIFLSEIVQRSDLGIDLHTAAIHRENLPQIRADLSDPILRSLAHEFSAPALLNASPPPGTLRAEAAKRHVPILVYEAGEALRFDEVGIRIGLRGIVSVLRRLGMLPASRQHQVKPCVVLNNFNWIRAVKSGILRTLVKTGESVAKGAVLGIISDPFGEQEEEVIAPYAGVIIGRCNLPLIYEGEALFHLGRTRRGEDIAEHLDEIQHDADDNKPLLVEEPVIV